MPHERHAREMGGGVGGQVSNAAKELNHGYKMTSRGMATAALSFSAELSLGDFAMDYKVHAFPDC